MDRRTFVSLSAAAALAPNAVRAQGSGAKTYFYNTVGRVITSWHVDASSFALHPQGSVSLPAAVQYVWPSPRTNVLYAASSNNREDGSGPHDVTAFRIDKASGALSSIGNPASLGARPVNITVDKAGSFLLCAYNEPSFITVHRLNDDGSVGDEIVQRETRLDTGIYAHQVRMMPSNTGVFLVTRGNIARDGKPEDPGAIKIYDFHDGQLSNRASIAPNGGRNFGPRHLDPHPSLPFVYVALERQNLLATFAIEGPSLGAVPAFSTTTLAEPGNVRPQQVAGPIHVHPNGRFVYLGNRSNGTLKFGKDNVWAGGENTIAVYAIDPKTGQPLLIQQADTHGFHPRTFSIHPNGKMLVAAHTNPINVREGDAVRIHPTTLSVFRIADDGKLDFQRSYDVDTKEERQWWGGFVTI